jgi:hypothetical protein
VAGCFGYDNDPSASIKDREFLNQLSDCKFSQEGKCSME